jgi:Tol biopolymer transport system component
MRLKGPPPTPAAEQVALDATAGWARASLSREGSLIYQSALAGLALTLVNIDTRAETSLLPDRRAYAFPRFSPDGRRLAVSIIEATGTTDLWILDRNAGTLQRLTEADGTNDRAEWTPDGKRVVFRSSVGQGVELRWQAADRSSAAVTLQPSARGFQLNEGVVSPNGEWLVFRVFGQNNPMDVWYRRMSGDTTTQKLLVGAAYETGPRFSPDGKWLAYSSDESGPRQVYVTPFPGPGPRHQVSVDGGQEPVWSPDGKRLYYVREPQVMAVSVTLAPTFAVTERRIVLDGNYTFNYVHANYDVAPDGKHLLVLKRDVEAQAIVVRNWSSTLARRAAR